MQFFRQFHPIVFALLVLLAAFLAARGTGIGGRRAGLGFHGSRIERGWLRRFFAGVGGLLLQLVIGGAGLAVLLLPETLAGTLRASRVGDLGSPILFLAVVMLLGLAEEYVFRGVLQTAAVNVLGVLPGIVFPVLVSSLLLAAWLPQESLLLLAGIGLALGAVRQLTGSAFGVGLARGLAAAILGLGVGGILDVVQRLTGLLGGF